MFRWFFKWREERRKLKIVREVLPLMYEELSYRQRALIYTLLRKSLITGREALDMMAIMSESDFANWMSRQPKLETFIGPAEISEEDRSHESQNEAVSDDVLPFVRPDDSSDHSG